VNLYALQRFNTALWRANEKYGRVVNHDTNSWCASYWLRKRMSQFIGNLNKSGVMLSQIPESVYGTVQRLAGSLCSPPSNDSSIGLTQLDRRQFLAGGSVVAASAIPGWLSADQIIDPSPQAIAAAYVRALDDADRNATNELIANEAPLEPWSPTEFEWVAAFDIDFVRFETVEEGDTNVIGDITMSIAGNTNTVRYRFRRVENEWLIWSAPDGLRVSTAVYTTPRSAAQSYIKGLDSGDRDAANAVIADTGELDPWSATEFDWVGAFDFEFVGFETLEEGPGDVIGDVTIAIGENTETVRYRFRKTKNEWMLWEASESGLR